MRRTVTNCCLFALSVGGWLAVAADAASSPPAVVSQLQVISIHVRDYPSFDSVFLFFRDQLRLPLLYGELSTPEKRQGTLYAGFSAGNAYFEPCGPYASDAPFAESSPARFHGLTFSVAESAARSSAELDRRGLPHSGVKARISPGGEAGFPRFIYLSDRLLAGKLRAVSLWECGTSDIQVSPNFLRSSLDAVQGGALGLKRVEEVRLGYLQKQSLKRWDQLLSPARRVGYSRLVGQGPALHFVRGGADDIREVVLRVESLERAKVFLQQHGLLGLATPDRLELAPEKAFGLRILLIQK
jgi:hypothetical protein